MILNKQGEDWLSKDNILWLHGALAILVFISHIPNYLGLWIGTTVGSIIQSFGSWAVGLFFFLSGFGLYSSYKNREDEYVRHFPKNRLLPFYLNYLILIVVYVAANLLLDNKVNVSSFVISFFIGGGTC